VESGCSSSVRLDVGHIFLLGTAGILPAASVLVDHEPEAGVRVARLPMLGIRRRLGPPARDSRDWMDETTNAYGSVWVWTAGLNGIRLVVEETHTFPWPVWPGPARCRPMFRRSLLVRSCQIVPASANPPGRVTADRRYSRSSDPPERSR
jgi:hypothetical protein